MIDTLFTKESFIYSVFSEEMNVIVRVQPIKWFVSQTAFIRSLFSSLLVGIDMNKA